MTYNVTIMCTEHLVRNFTDFNRLGRRNLEALNHNSNLNIMRYTAEEKSLYLNMLRQGTSQVDVQEIPLNCHLDIHFFVTKQFLNAYNFLISISRKPLVTCVVFQRKR